MNFLDAVAERLLEANHPQMHRVMVVFPSVRPVESFRHALGRRLSSPALSPICQSLDEWVFESSHRIRPNRLALQEILYQAYQQCAEQAGMIPDSLETYLSWSGGLLQDFEEMDRHLLDATRVFGHLHQQKAVELWSPSEGRLSETESEYLRFYEILGATYQTFRGMLDQRGWAYPSLALRSWLEQHAFPLDGLQDRVDVVYWVGFGSVYPGMQQLIQKGSLSLPQIWINDADAYYAEDALHSAGLLLRENPLKPSPSLIIPDNLGHRLGKGLPILHACSCHGLTEQIDEGLATVYRWLDQGIAPHRIGWVLSDSSQAWPLMMRWNPEIHPPIWNLPLDLRWTATYAWAVTAIDLIQTFHFAGRVPARDWNGWIQNPLSHPDWSSLKSPAQGQVFRQEAQSWMWQGKPLLSLSQSAHENYLHLADLSQNLASEHPGLAEMEQNALMALATMIREIAPHVPQIDNPWNLWRKLWSQHLSSASLNPGPVERNSVRITTLDRSQAMDFDYLIVSGANEGQLPKPGRYSGLLSFDLRRSFGLPDPWFQEAEQAYSLYRLLQHSQEVCFLWSTTGTEGKATEKSRYLQQLELEYRGSFEQRTRQTLPGAGDNPSTLLLIPKTPSVREIVRDRLVQRPLSPSTMAAYLECPLKFWYGYVRRIRIPEEESAQLNAAQTGTLLHHTLEKLFEPHLGALLTPDLLQSLEPLVDSTWRESQKKHFPWHSFDEGLNAMIDRMGQQFIHQYLRSETKSAQRNPATLIEQEGTLEATCTVDEHDIPWRGRLDRLESRRGLPRIVDFKSGILKDNASELKIKNLETCFDGEHSKAFQLMCYGWMAYRSNPDQFRQGLELAILPLQQAEGGPRLLTVDGQSRLTPERLEEFEELLRVPLHNILSEDLPLEATTNVRKCSYCDFNRICQRPQED